MFFTNINLLTIVGAILLLAVLMIVNHLTSNSKKLSVLVYLIFPIVMTLFVWPRLAGGNVGGTWFAWVKTYSALAGVLIFMGIRYNKKLAHNKLMLMLPAAILAINILEAVVADLQTANKTGQVVAGLTYHGGPWNIINAIAGIILIFTITGTFGIKVANTPSKDMVWADMGWPWIIAYDLWNISYCYNCIANRSFYAGVILILSCTFSEFFIKRGIWLQHRAQTLALFAMFSLTVDYSSYSLFQITSTHAATPKMILAVLSLLANIGVLLYEVIVIKRSKRNPLTDEIYVETNFYQQNLEANNLA